jgi:seryl-tRNA synthetase
MLQVAFIRQNVELVKQRLAIKNFKQPELVDELLQWDDKRKQYQQARRTAGKDQCIEQEKSVN